MTSRERIGKSQRYDADYEQCVEGKKISFVESTTIYPHVCTICSRSRLLALCTFAASSAKYSVGAQVIILSQRLRISMRQLCNRK